MLLLKTLVLPSDDTELAGNLLRDFILKSKYVLFIVIGDDSKARETVELVDKRSGKIEEPQWVVWVRSPEAAKAALEELKLSDANLLKDWNKVLAVCVNPKATICFVLENNKVPVSAEILLAFSTCKKTENIDKVGSINVPTFPGERDLDLSTRGFVPTTETDTKDKPSTEKKEKPPTDKKKTDKPK